MGVLEAARNPDNGLSFQAGKVGQSLTQMGVVSVFQLVLYQYPVVAGVAS